MFGKVFVTACFVTVPIYAFEDAVPQGTPEAPVEVGVLLRSDSIRIRNFADVNQVLILESAGFKIYRTLGVGTEINWAFTPHALDGVNLEIASLKGGAWRSTGTVSLNGYAASGSDTLWVQPYAPHSLSWLQFTSGFAVLAAGPSYLPNYFHDCLTSSTNDVVPAAMHVPGPTPSNTPPVDGPPKLEQNPLPPM